MLVRWGANVGTMLVRCWYGVGSVLVFWDFGILGFCDFGFLDFWIFGFWILGFWDFGIWGFWDFGILDFWICLKQTKNTGKPEQALYKP